MFLVQGPWNQAFLDEIDSVFGGGAAHDDQADAASGARKFLAPSEYGCSGRDDYRPIEGARRPFSHREGRARSGDPTSRQPDVPPSKGRRAREGR